MKIGVSLPPDYLAGSAASPTARLIEERCGDASSFLAQLKAAGAASIELRKIDPDTPPRLAQKALSTVLEAGLEVSIHGYLPASWAPGAVEEMLPPLAGVIDELRTSRTESILTLHSYRAESGSLSPLVERTTSFVGALIEALEGASLPTRIALELNREKGLIDPSTTYDGLLRMRRELADERVGFCWDFGHAYRNVLAGSLPPETPAEFVARVIHTHVHDLSASLQTHWPLSEGRVPLTTYVTALESAGYGGVYNLELSPKRYREVLDVSETFLDGVRRLARVPVA